MRRQQRQQQMADEYHSVFQRSISGAAEDFCDRSQVENSDARSIKCVGSGVLVPSMGGSTLTESSSLGNTANSVGTKRVTVSGPPEADDSLIANSSSMVKSIHGVRSNSSSVIPTNQRLSAGGEGSSHQINPQESSEGFAMLKRSGITSPSVDALHFSTMPVSPRDNGENHTIVHSDTD